MLHTHTQTPAHSDEITNIHVNTPTETLENLWGSREDLEIIGVLSRIHREKHHFSDSAPLRSQEGMTPFRGGG